MTESLALGLARVHAERVQALRSPVWAQLQDAVRAAWALERARILAAWRAEAHPAHAEVQTWLGPTMRRPRPDLGHAWAPYRDAITRIAAARRRFERAIARDPVQERRALEDYTTLMREHLGLPVELITGTRAGTREPMTEQDWADLRRTLVDPKPGRRRRVCLFGQDMWWTPGGDLNPGRGREDWLPAHERHDRALPERLTLDPVDLRRAVQRIRAKVARYQRVLDDQVRHGRAENVAGRRLRWDLWVWRTDLARARELLARLGEAQIASRPKRDAERVRLRALHDTWAQQQRAARALPTRAEQRAALATARQAWTQAKALATHAVQAQQDAQDRQQDARRLEQRRLAARQRVETRTARRRPQDTPEPAPAPVSWDLVCAF